MVLRKRDSHDDVYQRRFKTAVETFRCIYFLFVFPTVAKGSGVFVSLPLIFMTVTDCPKEPDENLGLEAERERRWSGERGVREWVGQMGGGVRGGGGDGRGGREREGTDGGGGGEKQREKVGGAERGRERRSERGHRRRQIETDHREREWTGQGAEREGGREVHREVGSERGRGDT